MKLSDMQLLLLHYAEFYKNIYELPASDRPDRKIIDNDAKLDSWYENFIASLARKGGRKSGGSGSGSSPPIPQYSE